MAFLGGLGVLAPAGLGGAATAAAEGDTGAARGGDTGASKQQRATPRRAGARKSGANANRRRVCTTRNGKRTCRNVARFQGRSVPRSALRTEPVPRPSGEIWLYSPNFREEVRVNIYDEAGELDEGALAQLDRMFRCKRSNEVRAVDPRLYETLSVIYDHFGKRRIELVSGFRHQRNEGSRHYHASAMDIRIPGVSIRALYRFAESLDPGGMGIGIYPRSGFVHVDWRAPGDPSYRWTDHSGPGQSPTPRRRPSS
jgi:uncharacterized protein YcbK (DUF882 family)